MCVQLVVAVMYGFMIPRFGHLSLLERFPKSKENKQIVLYVPGGGLWSSVSLGAHDDPRPVALAPRTRCGLLPGLEPT
jgi:hypothetical protein